MMSVVAARKQMKHPKHRRADSVSLADIHGVVVARVMLETSPPVAEEISWGIDVLAGRFVELSGGAATAALTSIAALILEAQQRGELAAWISARGSTFYPPDFAAAGIDLDALPVVHAPDTLKAARVADTLLRSGGFALVVLDLGALSELTIAMQTRLAGLAKKHGTAFVCLTRSSDQQAVQGSLVSMRGELDRQRAGFDRFQCEIHIVKDKQRTPGRRYGEMCRGPDGLC